MTELCLSHGEEICLNKLLDTRASRCLFKLESYSIEPVGVSNFRIVRPPVRLIRSNPSQTKPRRVRSARGVLDRTVKY